MIIQKCKYCTITEVFFHDSYIKALQLHQTVRLKICVKFKFD